MFRCESKTDLNFHVSSLGMIGRTGFKDWGA